MNPADARNQASMNTPDTIRFDTAKTIRQLLEELAAQQPEHVYCRWEGRDYTVREIDERVDRLAAGLVQHGLEAGNRVLVMLPQHIDHVILILALLKTGIVWVPVNIHAKGEALQFLIAHADPVAAIVDEEYRAAAAPMLAAQDIGRIIWRGEPAGQPQQARLETLAASPRPVALPPAPKKDDVLCISYSSGTTGEPKGSLVTDLALRMSAHTCVYLADIRPGDRMFLWEPLHHLGGGQVLLIALVTRSTFAMVSRFSASRFWAQVREARATHIHYLGGVLAILLKQPPSPAERGHGVRTAWGGGCPQQIYQAAQERFGVRIREGYGLTEISSFVTANRDGTPGSIGQAIANFEVRLVDDAGAEVPAGESGEIAVRPLDPSTISAGYFRNEEATREMRRDGWIHTGDVAYRDAEGHFFFTGRKKDSVRRRGENISAWEVERVIGQYESVEECALVGVPNDLGDEDLKLFVRLAAGRPWDPLALVRWCEARMPYYQIPRFFVTIDEFPRTPTQRIRKTDLPRTTDDCWDLEASGHTLRRSGAPSVADSQAQEATCPPSP